MGYTGKRFADVIASFLLIVLFSPLFLLVSVVLLFAHGRPVFYSQKRIGLGGEPFNIWKFRSMVNGADKNEKEILSNPNFEKDERITRIGLFLRETNIDELPQLFNILIGEMSFVGPRPLPYWMKKEMSDLEKMAYLSCPGITGLAQIMNRFLKRSFQFSQAEKFSRRWGICGLAYYKKCSLKLDIWILFKTIKF